MPASRPASILTALAVMLALGPLASRAAAQSDEDPLSAEIFGGGLAWREIGPYRGGRSCAVTGVPGRRDLYYFGAAGGGVWKTTDAGRSWKNVSDGFFGGSIGSVAVSEWDANVVYVGTGEKTVRGNVSHGDGMWRSTDAGRTWKHAGLADSRHIARVRVHPRRPDTVWAACMGHLFGPNEQRGVFRSLDGGATWKKVLYVSDEVGAVDLALDPTNPRILYATTWRVRRTPYSLESGGEGSGIWKSIDAGETWEELTRNEGLPKGTIGICGITVSPSAPDDLYAIIEAEDGGVFRSRDAGKTWKRTNHDRALRQRAWYYTRLYADPADADTVYVLNVRFHRSKDGGKTFAPIATPHGDNHDLWIDPGDPRRMIEANDGGANVSFDGGRTWSRQDNQPTAQMYRVSTDTAHPYRLLGGQQDNTAVRIRSRSLLASAIGPRDWEPTAGGESGHIVAKPDDPDVVFGGSYGGSLTSWNHRTGQRRAVNVWPDNPMGWGAAELKYRFQWNFPLFFSPHDPETLYAAANVLFRTRDGGLSWDAISGDLTRDDKSKQGPSGGPITKDNTSVEYYGTIFAGLESPHEPGVLWTGSDDGLVGLSRDGGKSWTTMTPDGAPEWMQINSIEAHPFAKGGLYVAGTLYKADDFRPYLFRTTDYGKTWTKIVGGIDESHFTRVIRADPDRPGLLYAGTERGVYVSFDDGGRWQPLQLNLPIVPVTDLCVKDGDLIAATQGRGFWILDDLTPLRELTQEKVRAELTIFTPRPAPRLAAQRKEKPVAKGMNPLGGAVFHYRLKEKPAADDELTLEILEENGRVIRRFERKPPPSEKGESEDEAKPRDEPDGPRQLPSAKGLNRFAWDLRYPSAERFPKMVLWNRRLAGPRALPGRYRARLTLRRKNGDEMRQVAAETGFEVVADPRSSARLEDMKAQFDLHLACRDKLSEVHRAIKRLRDVRQQLGSLKKRLEEKGVAEEVVASAGQIDDGLAAVEKALYQTKNKSRQDPLNYPVRLDDKLAGLMLVVGAGQGPPPRQAYAVRDELTAAIDAELARLDSLLRHELPALETDVSALGLPAIDLEESRP